MEEINFSWLAVCVLIPEWLCRKMGVCDFSRRLGEAAAPGWSAGRSPTLHHIPWHLPYNRDNHGKPQSG